MDFESKIKELQNITEKMEEPNLSMSEGKITVIKQDLEKYREENLD